MFQTALLPRSAPYVILLAATTALVAALMAQFFAGLKPCILCVYQRWPFIIAIALAAFTPLIAQRPAGLVWLLRLLGLVFLVNASLALFHVGVEQQLWAGTSGCTGNSGAATLAELKAEILAAPIIRCDEIAWSWGGLSMAGYNALYCYGLAIFALLMSRQAEATAR